jgi:hypothetical protein
MREPDGGRSSDPRADVRIEDYGLLGDTRTAALVAPDGSVDWLCVPRFDGDPVFGRLVGREAAGHFRLGPTGHVLGTSRRYRAECATLETTWETPTGRLTLTEAMVAEVSGQLLPSTMLVRRLTAEGGPVEAVLDFDPRLGEVTGSPGSTTAASGSCAAGRTSRCRSRRRPRCTSSPVSPRCSRCIRHSR